MVHNITMEKSTIQKLREKEYEIVTKREYHKNQVRVLTSDLNLTRSKIKYAKKVEGKEFCSILSQMFGKKIHELTAEELRQYNAIMQKQRREKQKKVVDTP